MEVVCVEVLGRLGVSEDEVEGFEDEELERGFGLAVQEEDQVAAESFVCHAVGG